MAGKYESQYRFGGTGQEVGYRAAKLLTVLMAPVPDFRPDGDPLTVWSVNDFAAFEHLAELETGIRFIEPREDVGGEEIGDLHRSFARLHTALPISEAERYWLFDPVDRQADRAADIHRPETLLGITDKVISGGITEVIQGTEIVRRLASWRRETDEFAHQGSLDEARLALGVVAIALVAKTRMPSIPEDVMARLDRIRDGDLKP